MNKHHCFTVLSLRVYPENQTCKVHVILPAVAYHVSIGATKLTVDLHFQATNLNKSLFGSSARERKMWDMGASLASRRVHQSKHHAKAKPKIQRLLPDSFHLRCSQKPSIMKLDHVMSM